MVYEKQISQIEIADLIFKDYASMTRIISLMIKKDYLLKTIDQNDKRIATLIITKKEEAAIKLLSPIINQNRKTALEGFSIYELENLKNNLDKISQNCKK